jgi:hypothetical protein
MNDGGEWTYRFYLRRGEAMAAPPVVATFGCFSYARASGDRIRLHFQNAEPDGRSPLGIERVRQRTEELTALFEHVRRSPVPHVRVAGASWLYNLDAYRRLFPSAYVATAHVIGRRFQRMPLWGQFLDRSGGLKENVTREFLERLGRQANVDGLDQCFPFQVLSVEAPVREFYEFYGIESAGAPR